MPSRLELRCSNESRIWDEIIRYAQQTEQDKIKVRVKAEFREHSGIYILIWDYMYKWQTNITFLPLEGVTSFCQILRITNILFFQYLSAHSPNPNGLRLKILHLIFLYVNADCSYVHIWTEFVTMVRKFPSTQADFIW